MVGIAKNIIGAFEDIGQEVVKESTKAPQDILGKALESLGASSGKKQQGQTSSAAQQPGAPQETGPVQQMDQMKDTQAKRAIARSALEQLAGKPKQKEPSIWERLQMEEQQKKEQAQKQAAAQQMASIPQPSAKRKRGDMYGMKAKKAGSEIGKNVKHD